MNPRIVSANGTELSLLDEGQGSPIVFIHGALCDYRVWEPQVRRFASTHRAIAYSRRFHHPQSAAEAAGTYTPQNQLRDLEQLILSLDLGSAHLVGHSYGGLLAVLLAVRRPELVRSLVLAEPAVFSRLLARPELLQYANELGRLTQALLQLARINNAAAAVRFFIAAVRGVGGMDDLTARTQAILMDNAGTLVPMLTGFNQPPALTREEINGIRVPALLIQGERSPAVFRVVVRELAGILPNSRIAVLPGLSHGLHLENGSLFERSVAEFLSGLTA